MTNSKLEELMALAEEYGSCMCALDTATPFSAEADEKAYKDARAALQDTLKAVVEDEAGIATLSAEVDELRAHAKKCDEWMEEAVEYVNRQIRSPSLEREGRDLRCRFAAIDAARKP